MGIGEEKKIELWEVVSVGKVVETLWQLGMGAQIGTRRT